MNSGGRRRRFVSTHPLAAATTRALDGLGELVISPDTSPATLVEATREADILIVRAAEIPVEVFDTAHRLRAAVRHGAGVDFIPVAAATDAGVLVANVPGANARSVAEHVMMGILLVARRFRAVDTTLRREGWWAAKAAADEAAEIHGRTLGLVGTGAVAQAVAAVAAGFAMRVRGYSPSRHTDRPGIEPAELSEVITHSDIVVIACPLTDETAGMVDAAFIAAMRPGAVLVNVARGRIVDEEALMAALESRHLAGAVLDVFHSHPLDPGHHLFQLDNVILTPHTAGLTIDAMDRMGAGAVAEVRRVLGGELPVGLVNPEAVPRYRERFGVS